jgi:aminoglycoside phosphotransferase (APT) family kinase protein
MNQIKIDETLVRELVAKQFPKWKDLTIKSVSKQGWDNRTYHLGSDMLVRLPSADHYAAQVEKEQVWLPKFQPFLPLSIPEPLELGEPTDKYPWKWSIYRYLPGESAATAKISHLSDFAFALAEFLIAFQSINTTGGPTAGPHSFHRGGSLTVYNGEVMRAIGDLQGKIDTDSALKIWESAIHTTWKDPPVWVHGDISVGNLLIQNGQLSAVIDFGQLAIGDPACDLAIAWTLFKDRTRETFQNKLSLDKETWARGRAWVLWKSLVTAAGFTDPNNTESKQCMHIIKNVIRDYKSNPMM